MLGRQGNKQRGAQGMGERSQREAGRCTIISDLVTCSGMTPSPVDTLCASQTNGLSPCSAALFLSHRQAVPPLTHTCAHTHTHTHHTPSHTPHTLHKHTHSSHPHSHILFTHTHTASHTHTLTHSSHTHRHTSHTLTNTHPHTHTHTHTLIRPSES